MAAVVGVVGQHGEGVDPDLDRQVDGCGGGGPVGCTQPERRPRVGGQPVGGRARQDERQAGRRGDRRGRQRAPAVLRADDTDTAGRGDQRPDRRAGPVRVASIVDRDHLDVSVGRPDDFPYCGEQRAGDDGLLRGEGRDNADPPAALDQPSNQMLLKSPLRMTAWNWNPPTRSPCIVGVLVNAIGTQAPSIVANGRLRPTATAASSGVGAAIAWSITALTSSLL